MYFLIGVFKLYLLFFWAGVACPRTGPTVHIFSEDNLQKLVFSPTTWIPGIQLSPSDLSP